MKYINITPKKLLCPPFAACPSIFSPEEGDHYVIIGKVLDTKNLPSNIKSKVGKGEIVVEIPKGLVDNKKNVKRK